MNTTTDKVIITVDGHLYDVTGFLINHPGEKPSKSKSIRNYSGQDISQIFTEIHDNKESRKGARFFLDEARSKGHSVGIIYLGLDSRSQ